MASFDRISIVVFFIFIAASHYLFVPAYNGYLLAFFMLLTGAAMRKGRQLLWLQSMKISHSFLIGWLMLTAFVTIGNGASSRDVIRDTGAVLAFLIGRYAMRSWVRGARVKKLFEALSVAGLLVAAATFVGAMLAYRDGATAYHWRGSYVPMVHSWLPYFLVINITLTRLEPLLAGRYAKRAVLCVLGTIASLSRTDFLLELFFGIVMVSLHRRKIFSSGRRWLMFISGMAILFGLLYAMLGLDVVQQRFEIGVGDDDASLQWRYIENLALFNYFNANDITSIFFGFGWGARLPLPPGVLDFDGNASIPLLHNSLLTIALKFGVLGLLIVMGYLTRLAVRWLKSRKIDAQTYAFAGGWILIFNLGKAVTLQGLTEWSHVLFFGIGCMLLSPSLTQNSTSLPERIRRRLVG